jgi:rSAM/selenodomain-associated transferase 2
VKVHVSAIVPVYRDEVALEALRASLPVDPRLEVVVSEPPPVGRGAQMNAGARRASGAWLLFLHADSRLAPGWLDALVEATRDPGVCGGWFRFALDAPAWQARAIERLVRLRVRLFHLPYGDQGLFVRRDVFEALDGFREWPLMEDVDFVRRLARRGRVVELPIPLATSPRRWERDGWFRRSARNLAILTLYFLGVAPARLARLYEREPGP